MVVEVAKQVAYDKRLSEASVMRANTRNLEYTYRIRVHSPDRPALQPATTNCFQEIEYIFHYWYMTLPE